MSLDEQIEPCKIRQVNDGFSELIKQLSPAYHESQESEIALARIEASLDLEFDMSFVANYGSFGHGTHIPDYSALDCFAVIRKSQLYEQSTQSLDVIHQSLVHKFPDAIITDGRPVVAVPFGEKRSEKFHIVPAFPKGKKDEHDIFCIPGPSDRWIDACPGGHSAWINSMNDELEKKLKPFIRIVKAWNYYNNEPLWSFYIELSVVDFFKKDASVMYSFDLRNFFHYMIDKELQPFDRSVGCNEPVYGTCRDDRDMALAKLKQTATHADKAHECEINNNIPEAYYWWRKVFNWQFPAF